MNVMPGYGCMLLCGWFPPLGPTETGAVATILAGAVAGSAP